MSDVVIVGAGLAGLACAEDLVAAGISCTVLERSDGLGGRVRTDAVDGYLLDRGFQIVLTAYPELQRRFDLEALELRPFDAGARVRLDGRFVRVADPLRHPAALWATVTSPVATVADKARVVGLMLDLLLHSPRALLRRPERSTAERLDQLGFSPGMVEAFWRPLMAGIQLDPDLEVTSRRFDVILRMLATGATALPARGIGALPQQLADRLPEGTVRLDAPVDSLEGTVARLTDGELVSARAIVVATDGPAAHRLLGAPVADPGSRAVACCWFSCPTAPLEGRALLLDGEGSGPARNVALISNVAPSYAPPGRALVAAAVPGPDALEGEVTGRVAEQLARWFGTVTSEWTHLRTDVIPHGQPRQAPPFSPRQAVTLGEGRFVCGDHRDTASVQGALFSGGRTAQAVQRYLAG